MANPKAKKKNDKDPAVDAEAAKTAFDKLLPRLDELPGDNLLVPNTAAIAALRVASEMNAPAIRARFESLPKKEFDLGYLDDLEHAALATWYATTQLLEANASGTEAKLPVDLVNEATDVKARMLRVCDYHFEPDTEIGRQVADIRVGTGYRDLAQDLSRLGKIFRQQEAALAGDKKHYRADDADHAAKLSHSILKELAATRNGEQKLWTERVMRTWTFLSRAYGEVSAAGTWLLRHEGGAERFPSLVAAGRTARRARSEGTESEGAEAEQGSAELAGG